MLSARLRRRHRAVADAPAVEHAVVGGGAEVVEHEVGVAHRRARRDQAVGQRIVQPLAAGDVGAHRHDARLQRRRDALQVDVAGQQHMARRQLALRRAQPHRRARLQRLHRRLLVQRHAGRGGGARQAQRVLQRMQVARARIEHAAVEARAGDPAGHLRRRDRLLRVAVDAGHALGPRLQLAALALRWWPGRGSRRASRSRCQGGGCARASGPAPRSTCPRRAAPRPGRAAVRWCPGRRPGRGSPGRRCARWRPSRACALRAA